MRIHHTAALPLGRLLHLGTLVLVACALRMPPASSLIVRPQPGLNDGTDTGEILAGKDTYSLGTDPDANYGGETVLVGQAASNCNHASGVAYVQFDLGGLPTAVRQVFLGLTRLPHTDRCHTNCSIEVFFYLIDEDWNEMSLTYNDSPRLGPIVYGPVRVQFPNDPGTVEYDITGIYRSWQDQECPNYGLAFSSPTAGCNDSAAFFGFYSSDHPEVRKRPYLRILVDEESADTGSSISDTHPYSKGSHPHDLR